jgi:general L-amino acid transport system substrate-binding protein
MKKTILLTLTICICFVQAAAAYTKEEVVKRDRLLCGVSTGSPGFSSVNAKGVWTGLDVDICRAVAAAVLGDATKVDYTPLAENESFTALLTGQVDILARHTTWTFIRDTAMAAHFAGISYYDVQGLMVAAAMNADKLSDLKNLRVCSFAGSNSEPTLIDFLERNKITYKISRYENLDLAVRGFEEGRCDFFSLQQSRLYGIRLGLAHPENAVILPDILSKEPQGPVVRQNDAAWFDIVKWSLYAMIDAEELGISSKNVDEMRISNQLDLKQFFGLHGSTGSGLGLRNDWAEQIVRQVGNYGEVFDRNLGLQGGIGLTRGLNKLWTRGGLQYAPPLR